MPHILSVSCPDCGQHADFTFSVANRVDRKYRPYFERSKSFKTEVQNTSHGRAYLAWYDFGLARKSLDVINDLPEGFEPSDFGHSQYYSRHGRSRGVIVCSHCGFRRLHKISWPRDAYFKIEHNGNELWAFNREMGLLILNYLKDPARKKRIYGYTEHKGRRSEIISQHSWLRKLPTVFQTKKVAPKVIAKLEKSLGV